MDKKKSSINIIESTLEYHFKDVKLLEESLIHKSYAYENLKHELKHNERLEFLGDAVLDLVISDLLMELSPHASEGELSRFRASIVNEDELAILATKLNIGKLMYLGKCEEQTEGRKKASLLANTYEALLGAIYMDGGYEAVHRVIKIHFTPLLKRASQGKTIWDYKTKLQEETQKLCKKIPLYRITKEKGPDHDKTFQVEVQIPDLKEVRAFGSGKSKKEAEQEAAKSALKLLKLIKEF